MRKGKLSRKKLIENINNIMPKNLSEVEKLAIIEKAIADNIVFDEGYLWSDEETRKKIYKLSKREAQIPKDEMKRKIICINMAELYAYVCKKFGLDVELQRIAMTFTPEGGKVENEIGGSEILNKISEEKLDHVCPIANLKDGRTIIVDIQSDLDALQTRSTPMDFGTENICSNAPKKIDTLSKKEIIDAFRKAYGLEADEEFTEEYIKELNYKFTTEQLEPMDKIKKIIEDFRIQQEVQHLGVIGLKDFYKRILCEVLGIANAGVYFRNGTRANVTSCSISNGKGTKKYSIFLYMQDFNNQVCYIFSKKHRKMISVTPEELYLMEKQSMVIRPVCSEDERTIQTDIIDKSMRNFINLGAHSVNPKEKKINMDEFFIDEYDEDEEEK